ncbi:hypothetical protein IWW46_004231, partial [Coemansia sp. RSA 2440]
MMRQATLGGTAILMKERDRRGLHVVAICRALLEVSAHRVVADTARAHRAAGTMIITTTAAVHNSNADPMTATRAGLMTTTLADTKVVVLQTVGHCRQIITLIITTATAVSVSRSQQMAVVAGITMTMLRTMAHICTHHVIHGHGRHRQTVTTVHGIAHPARLARTWLMMPWITRLLKTRQAMEVLSLLMTCCLMGHEAQRELNVEA